MNSDNGGEEPTEGNGASPPDPAEDPDAKLRRAEETFARATRRFERAEFRSARAQALSERAETRLKDAEARYREVGALIAEHNRARAEHERQMAERERELAQKAGKAVERGREAAAEALREMADRLHKAPAASPPAVPYIPYDSALRSRLLYLMGFTLAGGSLIRFAVYWFPLPEAVVHAGDSFGRFLAAIACGVGVTHYVIRRRVRKPERG